jgi:tetratricopeptide (TPR) repeat protein
MLSVAPATADDIAACRNLSGDKAIDACTRAIASGKYKDNSLADLYSWRGTQFGNVGQYERAIQDLDRASQIAPPTAGVLKYRCWTLTIAGQPDKALADCNRSLQLESDDEGTLNSRGLAYLRLGQLDQAIADYDAALRKAPKLQSALYGRGIAKRKKGDLMGGNADIAAATTIQPNIAEDFARYGVK